MIAICWGRPEPGSFRQKFEGTPLEMIMRDVAAKHKITVLDLKSHRRGRKVAWPRQEAMYRAATETSLSLPAIATHFGGRDHTTVMHAIKAHKQRLAESQV